MTNTDNNYLTEEDFASPEGCCGFNEAVLIMANEPEQMKNYLLSNQESIIQIREYLAVMENEPEGYIKISEVYYSLHRMIGDE